MPESRYPGVYVEEIPSGPRPISGVSTSVAGMVGPTHRGPVHGLPQRVLSYKEYADHFGEAHDLVVPGNPVPCYMAHAARVFFENGGRELFVVRVAGADGGAPTPADYAGGEESGVGGRGFRALEAIEPVSVVLVPAAVADPVSHAAITLEMQRHCDRMRYRVGIVDPPRGASPEQVLRFREPFDDSHLALYYPWLVVADPARGVGAELLLPPSAFVAGIYARNDAERGVHKAPANVALLGVLRVEKVVSETEQEDLNPRGVNCIRFPGLGILVWGARTLSQNTDWRYVSVRRLTDYLEKSIQHGTEWVVFEPNTEPAWARLREAIGGFLTEQWKSGALQGSKPSEAFFVRCDRTTMTQDDLDNGSLICLVGVALLRPAEFVILRISQKTAEA